MLIIALAPQYISKPDIDMVGTGARRDDGENMQRRINFEMAKRRTATLTFSHGHVAKKANLRLSTHARAVVRLPSQAATSTVFAIDKKKGKEGIDGLRMLHCFCPFCAKWYYEAAASNQAPRTYRPGLMGALWDDAEKDA